MKKRRYATLARALVIVLNFSMFGAMQASAHSAMLDIAYDDCEAERFDDGINEVWYFLDKNAICWHLSHEESTIKYYFKDTFSDGEYTWTTDVSEAVAQEIKNAYADSMKKWNNVYFYSYNVDGTITKNRIINVVEGTELDHNLVIFPGIDTGNIAATGAFTNGSSTIETGDVVHKHYSEWYMEINIDYFYEHGTHAAGEVNVIREQTGAHELGHMLGLRDVDTRCNAASTGWHHEELLMGYGELQYRSTNITYRDIAGVAITRGFHTNNDHKWLYAGQQNDGTYKLICTICNGVKCVDSLSGYTYDVYGSCGDRHYLSSGNMMAVASYGTKDYYKCKYCRYVEEFRNNVEQNYVATTSIDSTQHKSINNVTGLSYAVYEEHSYNNCVYKNELYHTATCDCGYQRILMHWTKESELTGGRYERCAGCGAWIDLRDNILPGNPLSVVTKVSANGSYILPSGIAVIVDADVEAYMNETLIFYNPDDVPVTQ